MSAGATPVNATPKPVALSAAALEEARAIIARYPEKRAAMLPVLWLFEREVGEVNLEVERQVAALLEVPPAAVREVTTFYTMFRRPGTGTHVIQVCHTVSCALRGAAEVVAAFRRELGIGPGETTPDGRFTLMKVECLGACEHAPCLQVNDVQHDDLTPDLVPALVRELGTK
jgi:NADH-quinone oxidoreductase E subunit